MEWRFTTTSSSRANKLQKLPLKKKRRGRVALQNRMIREKKKKLGSPRVCLFVVGCLRKISTIKYDVERT